MFIIFTKLAKNKIGVWGLFHLGGGEGQRRQFARIFRAGSWSLQALRLESD